MDIKVNIGSFNSVGLYQLLWEICYTGYYLVRPKSGQDTELDEAVIYFEHTQRRSRRELGSKTAGAEAMRWKVR